MKSKASNRLGKKFASYISNDLHLKYIKSWNSTIWKTAVCSAQSIKSCPSLCFPVVCSPSGSSVHGDSPGKNTGLDCHALLQGIFPTQGSNPGFSHCRLILLPSEPPWKPKNTGVSSLSLFQGIFLTQRSNWGLLHCRQILYQLSCQGSPKHCNTRALKHES